MKISNEQAIAVALIWGKLRDAADMAGEAGLTDCQLLILDAQFDFVSALPKWLGAELRRADS